MLPQLTLSASKAGETTSFAGFSRPWLQYAAAASLIGAAFLTRLALDGYWGPAVPYATFYAAMVVIASLSDLATGITALLICLFLGDFFFTNPRHTIGFVTTGEWLTAGTFMLVCGTWLSFVRGLRRKEQALQASRTRAEAALAELNKAHVRTRLLADTASQLLLSSEPRYVVNSLCAKVMTFLDCDAFLNFLVDEDSPGSLRLNACAGIPEHEANRASCISMDITISGSAVREQVPVIAEDILHKPDPRTGDLARNGFQAYACHPMKAQERVFGTLAFASRSRTSFQSSELALMKAVADLVAIALERQRSQAELKRMNLQLEQRVKERTRSLEELTEQLNTFCYSVAHDLRSPLRTQIGFSRLLVEDYGAALGQEGKRYAELVLTAAERQSNIVQDLMAHINVSCADMPLQPIPLGDAIARARADLSLEMSKNRAIIDDSQANGETVIANSSSLHLVILNLLTNACKFVPPGRDPQVRLWTQVCQEPSSDPNPNPTPARATGAGVVNLGTGAAAAGNTLATPCPSQRKIRLWVEDNGIGIDPKDQPKLFRMFQRLSPPSLYPGTGMGLAIVKKAIERMGGAVGAESEPGIGSRFWVELPAAPSI